MQQYLSLLSDVMLHGEDVPNRTGIGTRSGFGRQFVHDLREGFPLLTTKRISWKSVFGEMLWFIRGETNIHSLLKDNITIWTDWPYKRYKRALGDNAVDQKEFEQRIVSDEDFAVRWGDCGPIYGRQWRQWDIGDKVELYGNGKPVGKDVGCTTYIDRVVVGGQEFKGRTTYGPPYYIDQLAEAVGLEP